MKVNFAIGCGAIKRTFTISKHSAVNFILLIGCVTWTVKVNSSLTFSVSFQ